MTRRFFNTNIFFSYIYSAIGKNVLLFSSTENLTYIGIEKPILMGENYLLLPEAFEAFEKMKMAAEKDGLRLWGTSGYRSFELQKTIWNEKYKKLKLQFPNYSEIDIINCIIEFTAIPGTSRHHWGTDIDIVDAFGYKNENPLTHENFSEKGEYQYLNYWLSKNAESFGFCLVYTENPDRKGFKFEPWHYTYFPLSKEILHQICNYSFEDIKEMKTVLGNELFSKSYFESYKSNYLFGINHFLIS